MKVKTKMTKVLIIVLTIAVVITVALLAYKKYVGGQIMDGDGMVYETDIKSISYYHGGSDIGDSFRIELIESSFTIEQCEGNGYPTKSKKYDVGIAFYNKLDEVVEKYSIKSWQNLEKSDLIALDGPSTNLKIVFKDGLTISVNDRDIIPNNGWDGVNALVEVFTFTADK